MQDIEWYVNLPWTWQYEDDREDPGTTIVTIAEIPDFFSAGQSKAEALATGRDALRCHLGAYLKLGRSIPLPHGVTPAASR